MWEPIVSQLYGPPWPVTGTALQFYLFLCVILVEKPQRKRPFGRLTHRWEDDIKIDLKETEWKFVDWIHLVQDRDSDWHM
jgi:hypothetical protein